ncbi:MAG: helix-turn-helix transcriptional regulator [Eisenbergiella massiliensis]
MNWINDLQKAINYLEDNLTEDISYADVAGQANYSPYHFQNVFSMDPGIYPLPQADCRQRLDSK